MEDASQGKREARVFKTEGTTDAKVTTAAW